MGHRDCYRDSKILWEWNNSEHKTRPKLEQMISQKQVTWLWLCTCTISVAILVQPIEIFFLSFPFIQFTIFLFLEQHAITRFYKQNIKSKHITCPQAEAKIRLPQNCKRISLSPLKFNKFNLLSC